MHNIEQASGQVVADDTQKSLEAIDQAVMSLANLCASIVEVSKAANLPVTTVQGALANAGEGLSKIIATRQDLGGTTRELLKIRKASNLQTVGFGCPPEYKPSAEHHSEPAGQDA